MVPSRAQVQFYIDRVLLFLSRLRCSVLRPLRERTRLRNPCLRLRTRRLERAIVARGPHRICAPQPASAGCAVMLVLGTRSSVIPEVLLGVGVKELSRPPDDGVEVRKTEPLEARTVGRREGSEENVL